MDLKELTKFQKIGNESGNIVNSLIEFKNINGAQLSPNQRKRIQKLILNSNQVFMELISLQSDLEEQNFVKKLTRVSTTQNLKTKDTK